MAVNFSPMPAIFKGAPDFSEDSSRTTTWWMVIDSQATRG
ncbi:hypothetical protein PACID_03600 [Acidipropionibacterium acidipropionici ATCC 4875]|uniref:Uncharacterized protein n=1 Tax=Acidipropionibacterium acidipropionici (strain ATCC 4875 / DSM 20272 / JCM 6432 / NBRC 12425 / NCIMB 8070 / 4) TaxID=1171373 RepID=K7RTI0_ACIA4|nr:hypothetical protein PACID_03600 [Acidipropionibacterium acidipropionici ATCC 4875]